jgi:hypothetical protein
MNNTNSSVTSVSENFLNGNKYLITSFDFLVFCDTSGERERTLLSGNFDKLTNNSYNVDIYRNRLNRGNFFVTTNYLQTNNQFLNNEEYDFLSHLYNTPTIDTYFSEAILNDSSTFKPLFSKRTINQNQFASNQIQRLSLEQGVGDKIIYFNTANYYISYTLEQGHLLIVAKSLGSLTSGQKPIFNDSTGNKILLIQDVSDQQAQYSLNLNNQVKLSLKQFRLCGRY